MTRYRHNLATVHFQKPILAKLFSLMGYTISVFSQFWILPDFGDLNMKNGKVLENLAILHLSDPKIGSKIQNQAKSKIYRTPKLAQKFEIKQNPK